MDNINKFQTVVLERPSDIIIRQIRDLINNGELQPGDKLPSERILSERFGLGRTYVRDAIKKLEFYGILKTLPQKGTVVAGLDITAIEGIMSDVLKIGTNDFLSLVEARVVLEEQSIRLCAKRRTEDDLEAIKTALDEYKKCTAKDDVVNADFEFHRAISIGSKNKVLQSVCLLITSDILFHYHKFGICGNCKETTLIEHTAMYEAIKAQDMDKAAQLMRDHLDSVVKFAESKMTNEDKF